MEDLPFFGDSRRKLVEGLVEIFDRVKESGEPFWISLEAPSGWGKTRVGKRLFAELAARQDDPLYWPATLGESSSEERKSVVPSGEREPGSLPEFLWWGMSCSSDRNFRASAFRESLSQLESHGQYVSIACSNEQGISEKAIEAIKDQYWEFTQSGVMELASQAVAAAGVAFPGMGLAVLACQKAAGAARRRRSDRRLVAEGSEFGASTKGLVEEVVEELIEIGRAGFPILVFVEDVHSADEALLDTIDALLRRGSRLLLVTTTWPGKIDKSKHLEQLAALARDLGDRTARVRHDGPAGPPFADGAGLMELEGDACAQIVRHHYPNADPETVALLVGRYRNPYALELVCDMRHFRRKFGEKGDLRISREDITALPSQTVDLYRAYWNQLPEELRLRYAVAAAITPASISPYTGGGYHTWSAPVLDDVIDGLELPMVSDLKDAVEASTDAYGWVTHVDEYLRRWSETDQHNIASKDGDDLLSEHLFVDARKKVLEAVAEIVLRGASPRHHAARTIISLKAEGFIEDDGPVAEAVAAAVDDLGHDDTAISERISLYRLYLSLDHTNVDAETDLNVRSNGAKAHAASGRHATAADAYRDLHARALRVLGPDHPDTLKAILDLAESLYYAARYPEALIEFERAFTESSRVLGPDHPVTLESQAAYGDALETEGRVDESIDLLKQVLEGRIRVLDGDHEDTSFMRWRLAQALESAGRSEEAVPLIEQVLDDLGLDGLVRMLDKDFEDTSFTFYDISKGFESAGKGAEVIPLIERMAEDRAEALGGDHPDTIDARYWLALALQGTSRRNEVVGLLEQVIADRTRVLGAVHPDTIDARYSLAKRLWGTDRADEAESMYKQVIADRTRVLGAVHPKTIDARDGLATSFLVGDRLGDAEDLYRKVYDNRSSVLGGDHPDTISALGRIATVLMNAKRYQEASDVYEQVIEHSTRVRGESHEDTLELQRLLAEMWKEAGQIDKYVDQYRKMHKASSNRLGEDHPETIELLTLVSIALESVGRVDEALAVSDQAADGLARVLGEDHPETLLQRRARAWICLGAGRYREALASCEQALVEVVQVRGQDHPEALITRLMIGESMVGVGRTKDAIDVFENLLDNSIRVLGEHDNLTASLREKLADLKSADNQID